MRLLPILLLTSACAASPARDADLSLDLASRSAGPAERCVSASSNLYPHDSRTLVYEEGDVVWVNRLPAACPGLRPTAMLILEPYEGSRFCSGERFRTLERPGGIPGPYCRLGDFTPYRR
ncbi:MAG TPA: hypothetical protein VF619_04345 [Allosphingosinicella sp.]|jgi:hypothetical protein